MWKHWLTIHCPINDGGFLHHLTAFKFWKEWWHQKLIVHVGNAIAISIDGSHGWWAKQRCTTCSFSAFHVNVEKLWTLVHSMLRCTHVLSTEMLQFNCDNVDWPGEPFNGMDLVKKRFLWRKWITPLIRCKCWRSHHIEIPVDQTCWLWKVSESQTHTVCTHGKRNVSWKASWLSWSHSCVLPVLFKEKIGPLWHPICLAARPFETGSSDQIKCYAWNQVPANAPQWKTPKQLSLEWKSMIHCDTNNGNSLFSCSNSIKPQNQTMAEQRFPCNRSIVVANQNKNMHPEVQLRTSKLEFEV